MNHPNGEATVSGAFPDQAALFGTLDKVRRLNLPLFAVKRIELEQTAEEESKAIVRSYMTETYVYLAASPQAAAVTGKYFDENNRQVSSSKQSYDRVVWQRLWDESARLVQLIFY